LCSEGSTCNRFEYLFEVAVTKLKTGTQNRKNLKEPKMLASCLSIVRLSELVPNNREKKSSFRKRGRRLKANYDTPKGAEVLRGIWIECFEEQDRRSFDAEGQTEIPTEGVCLSD
jgi:hypothetical protein